jgi:uncharacterized protein YjbJ (UPF0337 family)
MDSKIDKIKGSAREAVGVLINDERLDDQRLKNRRKIDPETADARDAIEQIIDKATRATKEISKK